MKISDLEEKVKNSNSSIEKRKLTIERQLKQLDKKKENAVKLGADLSKSSIDYAGGKSHDIYWAMCDISDKEEEIKSSRSKLHDLETIRDNWMNKLEEEQSRANIFTRELPKVMKDCQLYLVEEWDRWDLAEQARYTEAYSKCSGYYEFKKQYSEAAFILIGKSKEEIHESNMRSAEYLLVDLYNRIKKDTGRITDWKYLTIHLGKLNGRVIGVNGEVRVETILAGGWNIQRLHIRTLTHKVNKSKSSNNSDSYSDKTIDELESIAQDLGITPKYYDSKPIYRMRLIMAIKAAK